MEPMTEAQRKIVVAASRIMGQRAAKANRQRRAAALAETKAMQARIAELEAENAALKAKA